MFISTLEKFFGTKHEREVKRMRPLVAAIGDLEEKYKKLSDDELRGKTAEFKEKIDRGAPLDDLLIPAFAVCREGAFRSVGMRHYDVQMVGGAVLHRGKIAEMKTGEGKTLVATLPCYLNALSGKGVHVVTVNDYLAQRDAEWMGKVHNFLGLSVGVIHGGQGNASKKRAYRCDITYGQNNEFGFDYLRDNMKFSIYDYAQRELNFAIVDEVDSILIDEARTPLIISGPGETASDLYVKLNDLVPKLRVEEHYEVDEKARQVAMTEDGMIYAQDLLQQQGLLEESSDGENLYDPINLRVLHILQQCLRANALYKREIHYMVTPGGGGEVVIIDEFTGRTLKGRRWSDGLHQAVEAKERVRIQDETITLATISFQNLFRLYDKLSGMTGTADTEAGEFHSTYKLDVTVIPTNKPIARNDHEDVVYKTEREKFNSIVEEIEFGNEQGQPVLVGTTSVEKSEVLARILSKKGIQANVLNAKKHESEAYVVAQAGRKGAVTVATNMAGRGTDIILGGNPEMLARMDVMQQHADEVQRRRELAAEEGTVGDDTASEEPVFDIDAAIQEALPRYEERCAKEKQEVLEAGGLVIVGTERHESRRIDNQLRGRSGRQGDPGESRFFLSLEDDLMRIFSGERVQKIMDSLGMEEGEPIVHPWVSKAVENAQKKVEERNFDIRKHLLEYDDVMNQQRKSMYALRKQVLMGEYRTVPTDEEKKRGVKPEPVVKAASDALREAANPIVLDIVKHHGAEPPQAGADGQVAPDTLAAWRQGLTKVSLESLTELRHETAARDVYLWFGCQLELKKFEKDPQGALTFIEDEVAMSLTEQHERLFDMAEDLIVDMVEEACPQKKHYEDWDLDVLAAKYTEVFGIEATGVSGLADPEEVASKLYQDAEKILAKKIEDFKPEQFLRLFRNVTMQEIDRQWIDHLQTMESLRDGIGLRGYGQRDPKREYKREGYELFMKMMTGVKDAVIATLFRAQQVTEEDLQRQEAQRLQASQKRLQAMEASHRSGGGQGGEAAAAGGAAPAGGAGSVNRRQRRRAAAGGAGVSPIADAASQPPASGAQEPVRTVKRDRPKLGRNDPCWCGSGKKYKSCHMREDQSASAR